MNRMKDVAKLYGLELNDKFKIHIPRSGITFEGVYWLDETGMCGPEFQEELDAFFMDILIGDYEIEKIQ
ncbi:hypothetical protein [Eubacterium sp.]|uniref:hypothetical protein n=1 Tax=Bacillota TaxID=1239 RepID=UPI0026DF3865|nr:hypothetical protein [Eubacterium sp.]MDO5434126.1 hypothetical protein [Eubacterium sp.]